ncbi:MAG: hypothetical protein R3F55_23315 [Alphaproteobacteria bacterium]
MNPVATQPIDDAAASGRDRRRELREQPRNAHAEFDGRTYRIADWSSSGVGLADYEGRARAGDRLQARIVIRSAGGGLEFGCTLLVVRHHAGSGELAAVFVAVSRQDRIRIAEHFDALENALSPRVAIHPGAL